MRNFVLGIVVTIVVLIVGGLGFLTFGLMPTNADAVPPHFESRIAMSAVDAYIERHAPHVNNPVPPTDENLIQGMKIYTMNCALCHGTLDNKPSPLAKSFYPPVPQVVLDPMDDPEWHINYAVRTGVRYTGMPAWSKTLSDEDMWKVTLRKVPLKPMNWGTYSGKIEFVSQSLTKYFPDDKERPVMARYIPSWEGPESELAKKYPLQLVSPHPRYSLPYHFDKHVEWMGEIPGHRVFKNGFAWWVARVHPSDAATREIKEGDIIKLHNDRGAVLCYCPCNRTL